MAQDIPTPEEIARVTAYMQSQVDAAGLAMVDRRKAEAALQDQGAKSFFLSEPPKPLADISFNRVPFDDETLPYSERGKLLGVQLSFSDGTRLTIGANGEELTITQTDPA